MRHLLHAAPVFLTVAILLLSFRVVYLCDLGYPGLQSILNAFQYAAKFHELLINASLSAIVLHRARQEMALLHGLPFGLVSAGYQLSNLSYLLTPPFWAALRVRTAQPTVYQLPFVFLLVVIFGLTAVVGPSSAIALIPKLDWWLVSDPFSGTGGATFIAANYSSLYPIDISLDSETQQMCLASGSENPSGRSTESGCPSGGYLGIQDWVNSARDQNQAPNITMFESDFDVERYLSASTNNISGDYSVASTVTVRSARMLVGMWQYSQTYGLELGKLGRPIITPSLTGNQSFKKPLVQVQCGNITGPSPGDGPTTLQYPHGQLVTPSNKSYGDEAWSLPLPEGVVNPMINVTSPHPQLMGFDWVDLTQFAGRPMIGAAFVFSTPSTPVAYLGCTIDAAWAPVNAWLDPKIDNTVLEDSPDPLSITTNPKLMSKTTQMNLNIPWAQTLNPMGAIDYGQNLDNKNISTIIAILLKLGFVHGNGVYEVAAPGSVPWICSTILALQVADGLARFDSTSPDVVYYKDANSVSNSFACQLTNINIGNYSWYPPDQDFDVVARSNTSEWTEVTWQVRRFGYGWGLDGITIKLAAAVLLFHVLLVLIHVPTVIISGWTSTCWSNVGEVLALAVNSQPSDHLQNTSAGVEKSTTWQELVRIREVGDTGLQLVFGNAHEGLTKRIVLNKKY